MNQRLKASDVYRVANYTRNQFRGLLAELDYQFDASVVTRPRVARTYSSQDFLVILVACTLETKVGLKRSTIASLLPAIAKELAGPRPFAKAPKLVLTMDPPTAQYIDCGSNIEQGVILPLDTIFAIVDDQLHKIDGETSTAQSFLSFGPTSIDQVSVGGEIAPYEFQRGQ
ncbi:hypothetical protein [Paenalcaligenes suwonensis]|uniref:hypothetical protein n=1 Tax=Paenalcaligenes suwonensis TaxID=1202713 RepID=UPI00140C62A0|nr:hypothetical protein [Paenalcaligenes suwonensis]NHC60016.1 hypothetical protein [Paenalcaligenes suwonensis]